MKEIFARQIETVEEGVYRINIAKNHPLLKPCPDCGDYCNYCTRTGECCLKTK